MLMLGIGAVQSWNAKKRYFEAALLSEAFTLVSPIKRQVSDYFFATGRFPVDNREANVAPSESLFGSSVQAISVLPGGIVRADFSESGGGRALVFIPLINSETGHLSWRCRGESIAGKVVSTLKPNCDYSPESQQRALLSAVRSADVKRLQGLLGSPLGAEVAINWETLFITAIRFGHIDVADVLIDAGASVDGSLSDPTGLKITPLMIAWLIGNADSVNFLLDRGADISIEDGKSRTALDYAKSAKHRFTAVQFSTLWTRQQSLLKLPPGQQSSPLLVNQSYSALPVLRYVTQLRKQCPHGDETITDARDHKAYRC